MGCEAVDLAGASTLHCPIARSVEDAYRELHLLATTPPDGVRFYSTAQARSYTVDRTAAADAELESLRQVPERIVTLSDRIKEDEEAAALLQMEETRRATGRDLTDILPSSLLAHTGSFMEYRQAIAEVAVISKEFYSACEEHKKCFKKKPFVGIRIQGAGDEDCNGLYERKEVSGPGPKGFWPASLNAWKI